MVLKATRLLIELLVTFLLQHIATAELYKQQSQMNMNQQKLEIDCTRWNSTQYMIQC